MKVFFSRIYFSINNIKEQFSTQFYNKIYGIDLYKGKNLKYSIVYENFLNQNINEFF